MARPREFDETAVLDAAANCFWSRGYEAVSVRDLASEMGITNASLYNAFGDKRQLYRRALDQYIASTFTERSRRLEASLPPRDAILAFFEEIITRSLADKDRKGCMLVNSAIEMAPHDPEFRRVVAEVLTRIEAFFLRLVRAGQHDGSIPANAPAADLARMFLGTFLGIRVLARSRPEPALLRGLARPALSLLDGP
jgi:TetR/AcrR family transcriptional repressor of nem operon